MCIRDRGSVAAKGRRKRKAAGRHATVSPVELPKQPLQPAPVQNTKERGDGPVAVRSPIVRRLAKELGVDPRSVIATGNDGAVTRADVLKAAAAIGEGAGAARAIVTPTATPPGDEVAGLHGLRLASSEKLSPLRKAVSAKMSRSRSEIPEATVWVDVDFTELWQLRPQMAAEGERPPSVTTLVARFVPVSYTHLDVYKRQAM